jgi:hypothetical protein
MKISFAENQWTPQDWMIVKYPGLANEGSWVQKPDCIINAVPADAEPDDMCEDGKYAKDTFAGMILRKGFDSPQKVASTMSFDYKMAPLIHITEEVDGNGNGDAPVLGQRYEVVLYDKGINVWEHFRQDDKIKYHRKLFYQAPLLAGKKYHLELEVDSVKKKLTVILDGTRISIHAPLLPDKFYVGIMGCEGIN